LTGDPVGILAMLEQAGPAQWLRFSRWGYAAVNTGHVLGIATLFGAVLALDLRLLGLARGLPLAPLARLLVPVAGFGLALAMATGLFLFLSQAQAYARLELFWVKMALVLAGTVLALGLTLRGPLDNLSAGGARLAGGASLSCWLAALVCGRMLAFVGD